MTISCGPSSHSPIQHLRPCPFHMVYFLSVSFRLSVLLGCITHKILMYGQVSKQRWKRAHGMWDTSLQSLLNALVGLPLFYYLPWTKSFHLKLALIIFLPLSFFNVWRYAWRGWGNKGSVSSYHLYHAFFIRLLNILLSFVPQSFLGRGTRSSDLYESLLVLM